MLIFITIILFSVYGCFLCAYMSVNHMHDWCMQKPRKTIKFPRTGVTDRQLWAAILGAGSSGRAANAHNHWIISQDSPVFSFFSFSFSYTKQLATHFKVFYQNIYISSCMISYWFLFLGFQLSLVNNHTQISTAWFDKYNVSF